MTIKSLTITEKAYDALKVLKHGDESFSDAILRLSKEKVGLAIKYFGCLKMAKSELEEWKSSVKRRRAAIEKEFTTRAALIKKKLS